MYCVLLLFSAPKLCTCVLCTSATSVKSLEPCTKGFVLHFTLVVILPTPVNVTSLKMLSTSATNYFWFIVIQFSEKHRWKFSGMTTNQHFCLPHFPLLLQDLRNIKHICETVPCEWLSFFIFINVFHHTIK